MEKWFETKDELPDEKRIVNAMDSSGNVQKLVRQKNLWFFPDYSMYVYYTPTRWQYAEDGS